MNYKERERESERNFNIHALKYPHTPNAFPKRVSCNCEEGDYFSKIKYTLQKKIQNYPNNYEISSHPLNSHIFFFPRNK